MHKSPIDMATDEIGRIIGNVQKYVTEQNKNVQPYQSVKVSPEEAIAKYISIPEEVKAQYRTQLPDVWNQYETKMQTLINRGKKNG